MSIEALIWALWGATSAFVAWLAAVTVARRWAARRKAKASEVPYEATAEELLEAQALGLIPSRPDPGRRTN